MDCLTCQEFNLYELSELDTNLYMWLPNNAAGACGVWAHDSPESRHGAGKGKGRAQSTVSLLSAA